MIPRPVKKLAHTKNGSKAGITSTIHNDMPFLAELRDKDGCMTIARQHMNVSTAASMNFFFTELKISMVYFIHKPWIYVIRLYYSISGIGDGSGISSAFICAL